MNERLGMAGGTDKNSPFEVFIDAKNFVNFKTGCLEYGNYHSS